MAVFRCLADVKFVHIRDLMQMMKWHI